MSSLLTEFLLLSYADLKAHKFWYWFGFPSIITEQVSLTSPAVSISNVFDEKSIENLRVSYDDYRKQVSVSQRGFFLVSSKDGSVHSLEDYKKLTDEFYLAFLDPCSLHSHPGWFLRNYLIAASLTFNLKKVKVLCFREIISKKDITTSIVFEVELPSKILPGTSLYTEKKMNSNVLVGKKTQTTKTHQDPLTLDS
jgi:ubiquitin-like modifier-activating enzyme ATG7